VCKTPPAAVLDLTADRDLDFEERPARQHGHHQAHVEDITLPSGNNFDQFGAIDPFDIGPSDGIGSNDFADLDLGINWGEEQQQTSDAMSVDGSVGVGRDAVSIHGDIDMAHLNGMQKELDMQSIRSRTRELSEQPFLDPLDQDFPDFGGMDLGDLGINFDKPLEDEDLELPPAKDPSSRACSSLSVTPWITTIADRFRSSFPTDGRPRHPHSGCQPASGRGCPRPAPQEDQGEEANH